ncbi:ArgS-related anticodon-binding protein NrtL [Streptomyces sp. NPDC002734]|uniref:ArgS-related anticodon-binding protein NrtL n=1 Tax=Streptomyces sp. NPDC002734 TaxID=3154426 RepID=UPI00331E2947
MTPVELSHTVLRAVRSAVDEGELAVAVPETVKVAPPGPGGCGDYATNVAMRLAKPAGRPAAEVAEVLRTRLMRVSGVRDVAVTGPGFLNISLEGDVDAALVRRVRSGSGEGGLEYGRGDAFAGRTVTLRVVDEVRARVIAEVVGRLVEGQGGEAEVVVVDDAGDADIRPVPAPADPAPLGPAAARWALLYPAPHDRPTLGNEHLAQREGNPLFRVRYAYARTRAASWNAARLGFAAEPGPVGNSPMGNNPVDSGPVHRAPVHRATVDGPVKSGLVDPGPAKSGPATSAPRAPAAAPATPAARSLLHALADHPRVLAQAAQAYAPDRVARHLVGVADATLEFLTYGAVLPTGEEKPSAAHRARLALAEAAGTVLAGGLTLLGIDAPDHL